MRHSVYSVKPNIRAQPPATNGGSRISLLFDSSGHRKYLTRIERDAFLTVANTKPSSVRTFCTLLAYSGARVSEILELTPRQIDFSSGVVVIESLKKRRRGVFRAVPIPKGLFEELDRVHAIHERQLDSRREGDRIWPWCRTTAWHHVKVCMAEARVTGRHATPKGLRHSFGVCVLQSGVPINAVKKWLGHSRITTTEIYADAVGPEEQALAARFWEMFGD